MARKPDTVSLNDFVKVHQESFISFELWLTDELTEYLVAKRNLDKSYVAIVIDIDMENPVYGLENNFVQFRFNGRFHIPVSDKDENTLELKPEQWVELIKQWFDENELNVVIGEKAADFVKFTVIMPVMELPEQSEQESSSEEGSEQNSEETESSEPSESTDETTQTSESPESEPSTDISDESQEETETETPEPESPAEDDEELKEFEKALGL